MPNIEQHTRFCVRSFGAENRELCYMLNGWIDAPVRTRGSHHRSLRHNQITTPFEACSIFGDKNLLPTPKNLLISQMVLQHLKLDGLVTPYEAEAWRWTDISKLMMRMAKAYRLRKIILIPSGIICSAFALILFFATVFSRGSIFLAFLAGFFICIFLGPALIVFGATPPWADNPRINRKTDSEYRRHQRESEEEMEQIESDMWDEDQHLLG